MQDQNRAIHARGNMERISVNHGVAYLSEKDAEAFGEIDTKGRSSLKQMNLDFRGEGIRLMVKVGIVPMSASESTIVNVIHKDREGNVVSQKSITYDSFEKGMIDPIAEEKANVKKTRQFVTEDGKIVNKADVTPYQLTSDGEELPIDKFDSTIGVSKITKPLKNINNSQADDYLVEKIYSLIPQTDEERLNMYELAKYLEEHDESIIIPFVASKGFNKHWGIITADVDESEGKFDLIMKVTRSKVNPIKHDIPSAKDYQKAKEKEMPKKKEAQVEDIF